MMAPSGASGTSSSEADVTQGKEPDKNEAGPTNAGPSNVAPSDSPWGSFPSVPSS